MKKAVEEAIEMFTGIKISPKASDDFKSVKVVFMKADTELNFINLSDGEKRIIDIIGKIVSHFVVTFKSEKDNLLDFEGVVLIDEIEKHLHPKWQSQIIENLHKTFPNIQFIVSTHSPQVVSNISHHNILIIDNFRLKETIPHTLGRDVNSVLYDIFGETKRPEKYQNMIDDIYRLLDNKKTEQAKAGLKRLSEDMGESDTEIKRIEMHMDLMN